MSIAEIRGSGEQVQRSLDEVFRFIGIPPIDVTDLDPKNTRNYSSLGEATRERLQNFYAPHNEMLFEMLGYRPQW